MAKDKYDFIHELLNNGKLDPVQRERVLLLTSEEIKKDKEHGNILEARVKRLEEKIGLEPNEGNKKSKFSISLEKLKTIKISPEKLKTIINSKEYSSPSLPKYYYPSSLYRFLFEYNQNRVLRSTCHEVDANALQDILELCNTENYVFKKHLEIIQSAFEEHDKKFCAPSMKALIRGYLTGKDYQHEDLPHGWSSDKIKINWSNNELLEWASQNNFPPNATQESFKANKVRGFDFDGFTSKVSNKKVQTFRELVLHFKSLFHIRFDNSLKSILKKINDYKSLSSKIDFEINDEHFFDNIELFTDVDKLIQGYIRIIELIIEQHPEESKPIVKLSFYGIENNIYLSIHHINSTYKKSIQDTTERVGLTYTNLIKNQLNGMCNLFLRADFGPEGIAEINLWNGKEMFVKRDGLEGFSGGVEHILEFNKK